MSSRIFEYFKRDDERFVSICQKPVQRQEYLARLQRTRMLCIFLFFLFLVIAVIGTFVAYIPPFTIILLILNGLVYLESDMKIKMIRLFQTDRSADDIGL